MGCAEVRDSLGAYVLGGLEPAEAAEVRRHLGACAACRGELRELEAVGRALDAAPRPSDPPPRLEEEIFSRIHAESSPPESREGKGPARSAILAASFATLAALAFFAILLVQRENPAPVAAVRLDPTSEYSSALRNDGYWGVARFYPQGPRNERVELRLNNLRAPARDGGPYEAWVVSGGERLCAGTFDADPSGETDVWLTVPSGLGGHRAVLVTLKPAGSEPGEIVLRGDGS